MIFLGSGTMVALRAAFSVVRIPRMKIKFIRRG